ncbi:uncharacterized protein TNCV_2393201 [Trichonephila clavipes]|nr:uncharacterized protein TNCV_2393201 [Trichonephila clavipes]
MVLAAVAYNTRSLLILIRGTMTSCRHMCCHSCNGSQELFFNKALLGLTRQGYHKTVSAILLHFLGLSIPRFVSNRANLESFATASWASHEFVRTRGKYGTKCLKTSYRTCMPQCPTISHRAFALEGVQQSIKSPVILPFSLK